MTGTANHRASGPPQSAKTQRPTILRRLIDAKGEWVASPEIAALAQQYNARVFELRKLGFCIENRVETDADTGERRSWFRIVPGSPQKSLEPTKLEAPKTSLESDFMRRRREEDARAIPLFAEARP